MFKYRVGIHDTVKCTRIILAINSFSICDDRIILNYDDGIHNIEYNYPLLWVEYIVDIEEEKKIFDTQEKYDEVVVWVDNDKCVGEYGLPPFKAAVTGKVVNHNGRQLFLEKNGELAYIIPFDIIKCMRPCEIKGGK